MSTAITAAIVAVKTAAILVLNPYNVAVMSSAVTAGFDAMIDQISQITHTITPEEEQLTVSPNLF